MESETGWPLGLAAGVALMNPSGARRGDAGRDNTAAGGIPTLEQVQENVWNKFFFGGGVQNLGGQGVLQPGKPGEPGIIREFENCSGKPGNVREFKKKLLKIRGNCHKVNVEVKYVNFWDAMVP